MVEERHYVRGHWRVVEERHYIRGHGWQKNVIMLEGIGGW